MKKEKKIQASTISIDFFNQLTNQSHLIYCYHSNTDRDWTTRISSGLSCKNCQSTSMSRVRPGFSIPKNCNWPEQKVIKLFFSFATIKIP